LPFDFSVSVVDSAEFGFKDSLKVAKRTSLGLFTMRAEIHKSRGYAHAWSALAAALLWTFSINHTQAALLPLACAQCDAEGKNLHSKEKQPRILCEEATFDFGSKDSSEIVDHTFVLKNTGTSDLVITAVRPACGCTAAELTQSTIPPSESAKLSAKLTLAGRNGQVQKPILIESNDPANPALQLVMKGVIGTDFQITPSTMVLRKDSPDAPATASVIVKSMKNEKLEITDAKSEGGKLKVRWDKFPDENSYQITANLEERLAAGQYEDRITLETNHPSRKQLDIGVIVIVPSPIAVAPLKIVLDSGSTDPVSRTIILKNLAKDTLSIDKIETPDQSMTSKFEAIGDFGARVVIGNIQPTAALAGKSVKILLSTGQSVQIPFEIKEKP
jgi:hypothetical protein